MTEFDQSHSRQTRSIRILCVDDPAVKLYAEAGDLVSTWSAKSGVKVELVILPWDKYPDTIFSALKSGSTEFDIVMLPGYFWLPGFAANKWLSPLSNLAANNPTAWQDYDYEDILPAMRKELEIDGVVYLLPSFSEVQIVYYRKDLLKKAGFEMLTSPVSMDTWFDVAKKTHEPTNNIFGTHFKGAASESMVEWLPFYSSASGTLPDGNSDQCLSENEAIVSLDKLTTFLPFCSKDVGESDNATLFELLTTGKVGIVNHWSGQLGPIMDANINPQVSQYGFASLENPWGTVWAFGIPSASNHKEDAFSCLLHMTAAPADIQQGKYSGSPARRSSFNNPQAASSYPWFPALLECIERKNTFPASPKFSDLMGDLYNMSHKVISGEQTPVEAIQELNRKLELE